MLINKYIYSQSIVVNRGNINMNTKKMTTKERAYFNRVNGIVTVRPTMKRNGAAMNDIYNQEWI